MKLSGNQTGIREDLIRWIAAHSRKSLWRMPSWMDLDDLILEGIECVLKCQARYGDKLDYPQFKARVMFAFHNRLRDIELHYPSKGSAKRTTEGYVRRGLESSMPENYEGVAAEDTFFSATLALAPKAVKAVLSLFDNPETLAILRERRQITNDLLCELIGTDPAKVNLVAIVKDYLSA